MFNLSNIVLVLSLTFCSSSNLASNNGLSDMGIDETIYEHNYDNSMDTSSGEEYIPIPFWNVSEYTHIYLFSRDTGDSFTEIIYRNVSSITGSAFDVNKITKVLIHGWRGGGFFEFETEIRKTYLLSQDVNVLCVDWHVIAELPYVMARDSVVAVGTYVAHVVDWLVSEVGVAVGSIHIIGHSLGAQVGGVIGEHVTVGRIGRISGLDPAGPGFANSSFSGRLDKSDAEFVDVIHTCGKFAGFYDTCGHVDFYPNKGVPPQPGCELDMLVCSHILSHEFFNASITTREFVSTPCKNWGNYKDGLCRDNATVVMGEHVDLSARGVFYLQTAASYPYAVGSYVNTTEQIN